MPRGSSVGDESGSGADLEKVDDTLRVSVEDEAARSVRNRIALVAGKLCQMRRQRARHAEQHPRILVEERGVGSREHDLEPGGGIDVQVEQQRLAVLRRN